MWEVIKDIPRGRLSLRKYLRFVPALLVACFLYIFATSPVVLAADATWSGTGISYGGNDYIGPTTADPNTSYKLPKDSIVYSYTQPASTAGNTSAQAHVIYFSPGTDPPTATSATYITYDVRGTTFSNPSVAKKITLEPAAAGSTKSTTTSCAIEGVGWFICPITNFLAAGMDKVYSLVEGFLEVQPLATTTDATLYRAWSMMRNFANIVFIGAFLVIIYSQITNIGLTNYSIKKMMPRIIVAAILVNTSYWICAVAVDTFNILGYSLQDLFTTMRNSLAIKQADSSSLHSWSSIAGFIVSGGTVAAAGTIGVGLAVGAVGGVVGVTGLIFLLLPLLISLLFVVLMTFLILAARQAIITVLVIIAPLAFVAYLLPNTEKWFEKWRSTFFTLLIMFPAFSLVFGGAQLAAAVIIQNANSLNVVLLGMAVQVAPLAITPLLLKLGGGVLNRFAGIVNNPAKGMFDRSKAWSKDRLGANQAAKMKRMSDNPGAYNRIGASRVAFRRDQSKRAREGYKTANETHAQGMWSQTPQGRRIYGRMERAKLEQSVGDAQGHEAWNQQLYATPALRARQHTQIAAQHAGDIYKGEVEATGKEAFEHALHGNAALSQIKIDQHTATGRAKLYEDNLTATAELQLQNAIRNTPHLQNLKVQEITLQGQADMAKANVEASGKIAFKDSVLADRGLRQMYVETGELTARADLAESVMKARSDANWNHIANADPILRAQRIEQHTVSQSAKLAEEQWNGILADMGAKGSDMTGLSTAEKRQAYNVKKVSQQLSIEALHKASAETEQTSQFTDLLFKNTLQVGGQTVREYAGGVRGKAGEETVLASAAAQSRKEYGERIGEKTQLIKHFNPSAPQRQLLAMGTDVPVEKDGVRYTFIADDEYTHEAALSEQLRTGSIDDMLAIIDSSGAEGFDLVTGNPINPGINYAYRTTIAEAVAQNGLDNKALFWGAKTIDNIAQGKYTGKRGEAEAIVYHISGGKIRDDKLAVQDAAAIEAMFEVINTREGQDELARQTPAKRADFTRYYAALKESAGTVLDTPELKKLASKASITMFERYR